MPIYYSSPAGWSLSHTCPMETARVFGTGRLVKYSMWPLVGSHPWTYHYGCLWCRLWQYVASLTETAKLGQHFGNLKRYFTYHQDLDAEGICAERKMMTGQSNGHRPLAGVASLARVAKPCTPGCSLVTCLSVLSPLPNRYH